MLPVNTTVVCRRMEALKFDIEKLPANSLVFNGPDSSLTRDAYIIRDVLTDIIG